MLPKNHLHWLWWTWLELIKGLFLAVVRAVLGTNVVCVISSHIRMRRKWDSERKWLLSYGTDNHSEAYIRRCLLPKCPADTCLDKIITQLNLLCDALSAHSYLGVLLHTNHSHLFHLLHFKVMCSWMFAAFFCIIGVVWTVLQLPKQPVMP